MATEVPRAAAAARVTPPSSDKSTGYLLALQSLAGAGSGAITKTSTAPLERVKIIFQIQGMKGSDLTRPKYTSIMQTMTLVTREEGAFALWKGNGANVLRVIPVYGLKFAFNDSLKTLVAGPSKKLLTPAELLSVGTVAGLMQTVLTYPLETVRTRLSLGVGQGVEYKGIIDCFKQMIRTEGASSLFKGLVPTIISGAPYTGLQMTTYELLKRHAGEDGKGIFMQLVNGAMAGLVAQTITYPGDTVRRRMQNNGAGGAARTYGNSWDCTVAIWQKEGFKGFYKGAWTNTVRAVPGAAIQFASYEFMKSLLGC